MVSTALTNLNTKPGFPADFWKNTTSPGALTPNCICTTSTKAIAPAIQPETVAISRPACAFTLNRPRRHSTFNWNPSASSARCAPAPMPPTVKILQHQAWYQHLDVGYTFDMPWTPRFALEYDYASGDKDPNDGKDQRFDTLFGARRFEFGPTGIYGAFARSNINTPGYRIGINPRSDVQAFLSHRAFWLAIVKRQLDHVRIYG